MRVRLRGGTLVRSLDPPLVEEADLHLVDGRVAGDAGPHDLLLDCGGALVLPGNVCAHTHVYSTLARGMPFDLPAPTSFLEILQRLWWRLDRALDHEIIRSSALVAAYEAIRSGTTTLFDHHASPNAVDGSLDVIAEAFEEVGIRSVLCYEITDRDGPQRAREGIEENGRFIARVADGRWPLSRAMVGAHASFTLSPATLDACVGLCRQVGRGLHVHVAEDAVDQADAVARHGTRVVPRLSEAGALGPDSLLAHAVHIDPAEAQLIVRSGATVAHNPRSNMNNGVGRTPLAWLGEAVALGSDGIGGDLFEESRAAYLRLREDDIGASPPDALRMVGRGARRAGASFGEPLLGRLVDGAPADVVVLDYVPPTPIGPQQLAGHWMFGLGGARVRHVVVAGEPVWVDGRSTRLDPEELSLGARRSARRLWERLDSIGPHPFTPSRLLSGARTA
jgi:putative selenium metabolism protein SsnA